MCHTGRVIQSDIAPVSVNPDIWIALRCLWYACNDRLQECSSRYPRLLHFHQKESSMNSKYTTLLLGLQLLFFAVGCEEQQAPGGLPAGLVEQAIYERQTPPPQASASEPAVGDLPLALGENPLKKNKVPPTGIFRVKFESSKGDFVMEVNREWAPIGAHRFYELVKDRFYDDCRFFRVIPGFVVQFGIAGSPSQNAKWDVNIEDDPVLKSNKRGYVTFATAGPGTRTSQLFINFADNPNLDSSGFAPFGRIVEGMQNVDAINPEYGESPNQQMIEVKGNGYLIPTFPNLDYITKARLILDDQPAEAKSEPEETPATEATSADEDSGAAVPSENTAAGDQESTEAE